MNKYLLACVAALFMLSACEKESSTGSESKNGNSQTDHWNDGVWTDDEENESLDVQEKIMKDSIEKVRKDDNNKSEISQEDESKESETVTPRPGTQEPRNWQKYQQSSYDQGVDPLDDEDAEEHDGILYSKLNEANDTPDEWTPEEDSKSHEIAEKTMPLHTGIKKNIERIQKRKEIGVAN